MIPITCNAVGDIIALATLFLDIAHALDEARGAPAKYRAFNGELKSLHIVLASVGRVAELTTDALLRDEIVREADRCGKDVRRALERVAKFSVLGRDGSGDDVLRVRVKRQWYKLEWRFGWHGSVEAIREELAAATQRLTSYLVISNVDGIQNLGVSITSQFDAMTARICMLVMEQFAAVAMRDSALSHTVHGNTATLGELRLASRRSPAALPGSPSHALNGLDSSKAAAAALLCLAMFSSRATSSPVDFALLLAAFTILMCGLARDGRTLVSDVKYTQSNSITLNDAMGRRLVLPLELCETEDLFHATLVNLFSRTNGSWFIRARRYDLQIDGKYQYNDRWDVSTNKEVDMSIVVHFGTDILCGIIRCPICLVSAVAGPPPILSRRCPGCKTELRSHLGRWDRVEAFVDDTQRASLSIEHGVNDLGLFPRARPTSMSGTTHSGSPSSTPPRSLHIDSLGSREPLSDMVNQLGLLSSWRDQVHGFTHFSICSQLPFFSGSPSYYALPEDCGDGPELHVAIVNGHYGLVAELLRRGADVDLPDAHEYTALHLASTHGHIRIVELLLNHGASIDASTEDNITPLACAVYHRQLETASLLVARGAMVDASDAMRVAVLYLAAHAGYVAIMRPLLRLGLDVNAPFRGETALRVAVRLGRRESVEVLLQNGADVNVCNEEGDTPLLLAAGRGAPEIFGLLWVSGGMTNYASSQASGQDPSLLLRLAIQGGSHVIVATVLQHTGAGLNARFKDGTTPLSLASERGYDEVVELLLAQGADPDIEASPSGLLNKEGAWKALHAAAYGGHFEIVEMLLQHDVDVNARTECGDTPLMLALGERLEKLKGEPHFFYWNFVLPCFSEVLNMLLSRGAIMDERSSLLLEEIARLERSRNNHSGLDVPGAWCEEAE